MISQIIGTFLLIVFFLVFKYILKPILRIKSIIAIDPLRFKNKTLANEGYTVLIEESFQKTGHSF